MKKLIITLVFILLTGAVIYAQSDISEERKQAYIKRADSVATARVLQKMKNIFSVSSQQEQALKNAVVTLNSRKRNLFTQYRDTAELKNKMDMQRQAQDSVYSSIVGEKNYALYTEALQKEMEQKKAIMAERVRIKFGTDSLKIKPNN
jgi:hypothetical protein